MIKKNILSQRPHLLYCGSISSSTDAFDADICDHPRLILIKSGTGVFKSGENSYPFKAADLIIADSGVNHSVLPDSAASSEIEFIGISNLYIKGHKYNSLLNEKQFVIIPTETYYSSFSAIFSSLIAENESRMPLHHGVSDSLTKALLLMVIRLAVFERELTYSKNEKYQAAKDYFDKNFLTIQNVDSVCKSLYINKFYLSKLFKNESGVTAINYLMVKKMEYAAKLLESSDDNIGDIARACAYADTPYFCRVFKQIYLVTPLQYRFNYKNQKS